MMKEPVMDAHHDLGSLVRPYEVEIIIIPTFQVRMALNELPKYICLISDKDET